MEEFLSAIGQYGFPMVVCGYVLIRLEKKMDDLTGSIKELATYIKSEKEQ